MNWIDLVKWLLDRVINDPVKFLQVLMFLALIFTIYMLGRH